MIMPLREKKGVSFSRLADDCVSNNIEAVVVLIFNHRTGKRTN